MKTAKSVRILIAFVLSVVLVAINVPFAAMAAVDDVFEDGHLIYFVTAEGNGSAPGAVTAAFNENLDPKTVSNIKIPGTVKNGSNSYSVTELINNAFAGCTALESLDMSECTGLSKIGVGTFCDCEELTAISVPCNFNKDLFADTGVVPDGNNYKIEYTAISNLEGGAPTTVTVVTGGTLTYVHNWKVNDKNYAEHICANCNQKGKHNWTPDNSNSNQHKCTVCQYTEAHYGGTADCNGQAKCVACGKTYKKATAGKHSWEVRPETIGATSADYQCQTCKTVETQKIGSDENEANFNGQKLKLILQDPYKVLPEGTKLNGSLVESGSVRYNELLAQLDDTHKVENVAFFELELYNAKGEKISGEIAGKVRILMQIPDGWDKNDLQAVLVMSGTDVEFEESIITIDGVDYLAFWTNHFSPYALVDVKTDKDSESTTKSKTNGTSTDTNKTSPATGSSDYKLMSALAVSASAAFITFVATQRKRKL
ncbi:MAG: hypothetical protein IJI47_03720 [Eubacterium sp.]|nr:hypothetical protein [Eubacterium sp.]